MTTIAGPTLALGIDASGAKTGANVFQQATNQIKSAGQQASKATNEVIKDIQSIGVVSKAAAYTMGLLGGAFAALSLAQVARDVIKVGDAYTLLDARLKLATGSTVNATAAHKALLSIAQESSAGFEEVSSLYIRLAQNSQKLGLSTKDLEGITRTITEALAVSGATATETAASLLQLGQAMSSGTLNGDEFKSISEQFPKLLDIISAATGTAREELKKMGSEGQLSTRVIVQSIQDQADVVHTQFTAMGDTVSKASTRMQNAWNELLVQLNRTGGVTDGLTSTMQNLTNFLASEQGQGAVRAFGTAISYVGTIIKTVGSEFAIEYNRIVTIVGGINSAIQGTIDLYRQFRAGVRTQLGMSEDWGSTGGANTTTSNPNASLSNPTNIGAEFPQIGGVRGAVKLDPAKPKSSRRGGGGSRNTELRDQQRAIEAVADANRDLLRAQIEVEQQNYNTLKVFDLQKQELESLHQSEIRKLDDLKLSATQKAEFLDALNKKYALLNQAIDNKRNTAILNARNYEGKPADSSLTFEGNVKAQFPKLADFQDSAQVNNLIPDWEKYFAIVSETNDATTNLAKGTRSFVDDLSDGLVQAIATGAKLEDIFMGLAQSISQAILKAIIFQTIMAAIGGGGSLLGFGSAGSAGAGAATGGATYGSIYHGGGIVGVTPVPQRIMRATDFASAPKFHKGGEVNAVLQRGEGVFTPEQMAAMGKSNVQVNIINNNGSAVSTEEKQTDKGLSIDVVIDQVEGMMAKRMNRQGSALNSSVRNVGTVRAR